MATQAAADTLALQRLYHWERSAPDRIAFTQPLGGGAVRDYSWREVVDQTRRMAGPVLAATMRLLVVAAGGSLLLAHGAEPWQLFALAAAAMLMYGGTCALAMKVDRWGAAR